MGKLYDLTRGAEFALPKKKFAVDYQRDARKALKGRWVIAIVAAFIVSLFGVGGGAFSLNFNFGDDASSDVAVEEEVYEIDDLEDMKAYLELPEMSKEEWIGIGVGIAAGVAVVFLAAFIISALIVGPVQAGYDRFNLDLFTGRTAKLETLFSYFNAGRYGKAVGLYIRYTLVMLFYAIPMVVGIVCTIAGGGMAYLSVNGTRYEMLLDGGILLAVIGGIVTFLGEIWLIVNSYKYCMSFKIYAEHPDLSPRRAMKASKKLMNGNKWAFFCLHLSYIGWMFLAILSCGIGFIWLIPHMAAADAAFYRNVSMRRKLGLN